MMNDRNSMMNDVHGNPHCIKCVSWSAVFVGALVGIGLSFLLNLFSAAIGLSAFTTNETGLTTLAIGGFVGMLIGGIAAMYVAGWTAGYLARPYCNKKQHGILYGFVAWVIMLIMTVLLSAPVGRHMAVLAHSSFKVTNPTNIVMTTNRGTQAATISNGRDKTRAGDKSAVVNAEKATNAAGMGLFLMFVIFFVGAIACCFGAHCGIACCDDENHCHR